MQCKGSPIPAGTTVSGSFTLGPREEEAGEEGGCEGVSIVVYGSETFQAGHQVEGHHAPLRLTASPSPRLVKVCWPGSNAPRTLQAFLRGDAEVDYFEDEP